MKSNAIKQEMNHHTRSGQVAKKSYLAVCILSILMLVIPNLTIAQSTFGSSDNLSRTYRWNFAGYQFSETLTLSKFTYNYYHGLPKTKPNQEYATEFSTHPYLLQVASALDKDAARLGFTGYDLAAYIVAFVQSIRYQTDPYNNGYDYPKYPIEMLVEQNGDCEDASALTVVLLKTFGFDALLVSLPGHMAAAIACTDCGGSYKYNGKQYSFIETTYPGNEIGSIPPKYRQALATLYQTPALATYSRPQPEYAANERDRVDEKSRYDLEEFEKYSVAPQQPEEWQRNEPGYWNTLQIEDANRKRQEQLRQAAIMREQALRQAAMMRQQAQRQAALMRQQALRQAAMMRQQAQRQAAVIRQRVQRQRFNNGYNSCRFNTRW